MAEDKHNLHCLHICGRLDNMMEEAANKKMEEKRQSVKPPIECLTSEDSDQLHEIYRSKVLRTEPSEEKRQMMKELMQAIKDAQLAHSMMLLQAKQEEIGVRRHPSTLSHMHHDDSDSEGEVDDLTVPETGRTADD